MDTTTSGGERRPLPAVRGLLFFIVLPGLIGTLLGANRTGVALYFHWPVGVLFWTAASIAVWFLLYAGSALTARALDPWNPPLWLVLLAGAIAGSIPARYTVYGMVEAFENAMLFGRAPQPIPAFDASWEFAVYYLEVWSGVYVVWVAAGLFFDWWCGYPRYGRFRPAEAERGRPLPMPAGGESPSQARQRTAASLAPISPISPIGPVAHRSGAAAPSPGTEPAREPQSALLDRLPEKLGRDVLALKAEDHYVRVYTDKGSTLVLSRISDAIEELAPLDGIRVHRSYWVRKSAVRAVGKRRRGLTLKLCNGLELPVSQSYKELVRQSGLSGSRPRAERTLGH